LREESVQGIGIAHRVTEGERRPDHTLTVFVDEKKASTQVECPVPKTLRIPALGLEVRTDVVPIGRVRLQSGPARPVNPGCSISLPARASGTLGCLVRRNDAPGLHVLTAGHVVTAFGAGDDVIQPGSEHDGTLANSRLAIVVKRVRLESTATDFPNLADGAIAKLINEADVERRIPGIGQPQGRSSMLQIGDRVQLVGQASGFQTATIVSLTYAAAFHMDLPSMPNVRVGFSELVLCTRFTTTGDSGAAVLNRNNEVVGIHLGGSDSASFFCRISHLCSKLGVEIA
jgi:hypothetical protein